MARSREHPLILAVDGPSAAGKSTLVALAARKLGWVPLAEAYDRVEPAIDLRFSNARELAAIERTLLAEEARRWQAARSLRSSGWTVVADTDFLGPLTYTAGLIALGEAPDRTLAELLRRARRLARSGAWGMPDALVYLSCPDRVRRARAAGDPGRHPPDLAARHEAVGRFESRFYLELLPAAFPGRSREVSADRRPAETLAEVRRFAASVGPTPGPDRWIGEVLAAVPVAARWREDAPGRRPLLRTPRAAPGSATVKRSAPSPRAPRG